MNKLAFITFITMLSASLISLNSALADDGTLQQEALDKASAVQDSEGLVKAGQAEVNGAKDQRAQLMKKINDAEIAKFDLDSQIQKLKANFTKLQNENEDSERTLYQKMAELDARQKEADRQHQKFDEENTRLKQRIQDLKDQFAAKSTATKAAEQTVKEDKNENEKALDERNDLLKQTQKTDEQKTKLDADLQQLKLEHDQLVNETRQQEIKLRTSQATLEQAQLQSETIHDRFSREGGELKDKIQALQDQVASKQTTVKAAQEQVDSDKKQVADIKDKQKDLEKQIETTEAERSKIENEIHDVRQQNIMLTQETKELAMKQKSLEARKTQAAQDYETINNEGSKIKEANARQSAETTKVEQMAKDKEAMVEAGREDLANLKKERELLVARKHKAERDFAKYKTQETQLKTEYSDVNADKKQIEDSLTSTKVRKHKSL